MIAFMDDRRAACGVEPICKALPIAPSACHEHVARRAAPSRLPPRAKRDAELQGEIRRAFEENPRVCGVRKAWRQPRREGVAVARCTVARLVRGTGLAGVVRGKPVKTTAGDKATPCPLDLAETRSVCGWVNRQFQAPAPNVLWVAEFTYASTWSGFVCVAFAAEPKGSPDIGACARRVVGWRVSRSAHAGFVLDALEQALHERRPAGGKLVHRSDRGSQRLALRYTDRLAEAKIEPSVGSVGDAYDNALAETINGLFKAEVIHRRGPWRSFKAVEFATLERVDWLNNRRLLEPIGYVPPAEAEARHRAAPDEAPLAA